MSRYRDPQLQVTENSCNLWNWSPNIYQCFKIEGIFYCEQLVIRGANKNTECLLQSTSVLRGLITGAWNNIDCFGWSDGHCYYQITAMTCPKAGLSVLCGLLIDLLVDRPDLLVHTFSRPSFHEVNLGRSHIQRWTSSHVTGLVTSEPRKFSYIFIII